VNIAMTEVKQLKALENDMTEWRHYLHAHPETAFQEYGTADFVAEKLKSFGLKVQRGIGGTGLVGTLSRGKNCSGAIGLRADMDALDIQEKNDFEYKSIFPGKMHACGHDGHTAMLLGAARYLSSNDVFNGTVHFVFQPAEENEGGGKAMVADGLFEKFPMDSIFALHNFPVLPEGWFAARSGVVAAAFDIFEITIKGMGGHAARPQASRDPIVAAAQVVSMFQTIISRNTDPVEGAVISVTEIKGGTTYNVIPDIVTMRGTTRHFLSHIQDLIESRMKEVLKGIEISMGVSADMKYERRYPAVVNAVKETEQAVNAAAIVAGRECILTEIPPIMGSEDFAFMLNAKPGAYIGLGAGTSGANGMPHQSGFDFNDRLLAIGACYWVNLVEMLLPQM
jgi:amidohydrolase